ncbi:MAG: 4-hydroxy-2-oxovalerate aldolase [Candidatus Omnitrophica bacterium]|nr:4-hydroxy-2-oxovalerate aldolase [Candidatus Omnitrophota bacterium]
MIEPGMRLARRLRRREPVFGAWTSLGHPSITEMFGIAKVDFVGIDVEHSTINQEQSQRIIAAAQAGGIACLPRVASHNGEQIRRLLDSGADGVIVPNVSRPEEIERLIQWCDYPPKGSRSYGVARAQGYGTSFDAYVKTWNDRCTLIIQIESIHAVEAIDQLLTHEEVSGVMIGPYDISGSLNLPGQLDHPRVHEACAEVIAACQRSRKACGTQLIEPTAEGIAAAFAQGYTFVVLASDVFVLWKWSERMREITQRHRAFATR